MPQPSITKICLKITCLKFHSNFPGANELKYVVIIVKDLTILYSQYHNCCWPLEPGYQHAWYCHSLCWIFCCSMSSSWVFDGIPVHVLQWLTVSFNKIPCKDWCPCLLRSQWINEFRSGQFDLFYDWVMKAWSSRGECMKILCWHEHNAGHALFNIKMMSYQLNKKSFCGDKMILWPSYHHNGVSYTGKTSSLYWMGPKSLFTTVPL